MNCCRDCTNCRFSINSSDCALVLASRGEMNTFEIAAALGVSHEYVRQVINRALWKLQRVVDAESARNAGEPTFDYTCAQPEMLYNDAHVYSISDL